MEDWAGDAAASWAGGGYERVRSAVAAAVDCGECQWVGTISKLVVNVQPSRKGYNDSLMNGAGQPPASTFWMLVRN